MDLEKMKLRLAEAIGSIESRRFAALLEMTSKVSEEDDDDEDEGCGEGCEDGDHGPE